MSIIRTISGEVPEIKKLVSRMQHRGSTVCMGGLSYAHKAHIAAILSEETNRPVVLLCADEERALNMAKSVGTMTEREIVTLFAGEFLFYNAERASREWERQRLEALWKLSSSLAPILICTPDGLMQRTMPREMLSRSAVRLSEGMEISIDALTDVLIKAGYSSCTQVEGIGQYARRGGIVDIFVPALLHPVRIEFFGDEIDTLSFIDESTQRRTVRVKEISVLPVRETLIDDIKSLHRKMCTLADSSEGDLKKTVEQDIDCLENGVFFPYDRYLSLIYKEFATACDYIPRDAILIVDEQARIKEREKNYAWQMTQDIDHLVEKGIIKNTDYIKPSALKELLELDTVYTDAFLGGSYQKEPHEVLTPSARQLPAFGQSLETAVNDIEYYVNAGFSTVVMCKNLTRAQNLTDMLSRAGIKVHSNKPEFPPHGCVSICDGDFKEGFEYTAAKLALICESDVKVQKRTRTKKEDSNRKKLKSYMDLSVGDYVVHEHHGIGRFVGLVTLERDKILKDYMKICYAGTDCLYVPVTQLDLISKYVGGKEDASVKLHKLGGVEWGRVTSRAKAAARELARELIDLYAQRLKKPGFAFDADCDVQREFEESFEYVETDDQIRCVEEIKRDMEKPYPMDRLLCGDVGFGKTEVALRCAMKCVLSNKQVAILVPTTVLCMQHYLTAKNRFANYPIGIGMLSRHCTKKQADEVLKKLKNGSIDIVIGTHKLLQKDVTFKDLGLVIVDEEQRFGVMHKEALKAITREVDVLTLSATPIPRTLNMAMSGIRDMSILEEAPQNRQPVQTYVLEYNVGVIDDAIRRELSRGGQVYYMYNRVESIDAVAYRLQKRHDGVEVAVIHGKMNELQISDVMERVQSGEVKILVCTTIIENGIDIPNMNTLIVEDADRLGLSQLHQIRGRVGRSQRKAYAYFTYKAGKVITEVASKRLLALNDFTEFGAGFKIAMRDLEIRGAGSVLGERQHGHLIDVGYDMYMKLLEEAVCEEKGEEKPKNASCSVDLHIPAAIPNSYIPSDEQRIDMYRSIAQVCDEQSASDMIDELCDKYGDVPHNVLNLIDVAQLKSRAASVGIYEIIQRDNRIIFKIGEVDFKAIGIVCSVEGYRRTLTFDAGSTPSFTLTLKPKESPLLAATQFISNYEKGVNK